MFRIAILAGVIGFGAGGIGGLVTQKVYPPKFITPDDLLGPPKQTAAGEQQCHRCGCKGEVAAAAAADAPTDIVNCAMADINDTMLRAIGVPQGKEADHYICLGCVDWLKAELGGNRKRKAATA